MLPYFGTVARLAVTTAVLGTAAYGPMGAYDRVKAAFTYVGNSFDEGAPIDYRISLVEQKLAGREAKARELGVELAKKRLVVAAKREEEAELLKTAEHRKKRVGAGEGVRGRKGFPDTVLDGALATERGHLEQDRKRLAELHVLTAGAWDRLEVLDRRLKAECEKLLADRARLGELKRFAVENAAMQKLLELRKEIDGPSIDFGAPPPEMLQLEVDLKATRESLDKALADAPAADGADLLEQALTAEK